MQKIKVISVNISEKKGTIKKPVDSIQFSMQGVINDAHAGDWNRQVSLLGIESFERFTIQNKRIVTYGEFAENITTQGINLFQET